jgi:hypothetical protein
MEFSIKGIYFNTSEKKLQNTTYKNLSLNPETSNDSSVLVFFFQKNIYILNAGHGTYNKNDI